MKIALTGGAYQARSLIASAQSCINLLPERIPQDEGEPEQMTHYPTPGLVLKATQTGGAFRGLYRARNGAVFGCVGSGLYTISSAGAFALLGTLSTSTGPVSMADNSVTLVIVDGTAVGFSVDLASLAFAKIVSAGFYGGDRVELIDSYFVLNRPGTNQFYLSLAVSTTFDPLYVAAKASLDTLVTLQVVNRQVWLIGEARTEIYGLSGAADFPLQIVSGGIEYGCAARHSIVRSDGLLFWVDRSKDGQGVILQGSGYNVRRVSTHAIEAAIGGYPRMDDAVGWSYQIAGHTVIVFAFPSAGVTWCYDLATALWHQWSSSGGQHRGICHTAAFGTNLVGDYANGNLYRLDTGTYTDNGQPITRTRAFPHMLRDGRRVQYLSFIADMETGTVPAGQGEPQLTLTYSDDRGRTWGNPVTTGMGAAGAALTSLQFQRLGMARDRVFQLSWAAPVATALQGAWVQTRTAAS